MTVCCFSLPKNVCLVIVFVCFRKFYFMTLSSILRILLKPQLNFILFFLFFFFCWVEFSMYWIIRKYGLLVSDMLEFLVEMIKKVYSPEVLTFCWYLVMNVNMDSMFSVSKNRSATGRRYTCAIARNAKPTVS